ncbi:MAG: DUF4382 domain-containing protein [Chitinophagaceae bacterium]
MKVNYFLFSLLLTTFAFAIISCKKDASTSTLQVNLTDAPASYAEVNIDIKEIRVNFSDDSSGWVSLNTNAKVYNLLALQNNVQTVLATGTVQTGMVKEIRFILGSNNTIVDNSISYPLTIPSGSESGLKIKIGRNLKAGIENLLIDFDAALSITNENGSYKLRPVLRVK